MPDSAKPVYLVDAAVDPVVVRIEGRACFQNSACLGEFITEMTGKARTRFVLDFARCTSMDSTFLGVLAGIALDLRTKAADGSLVLCRVGQRNLELINNLGLNQLLTVDTGEAAAAGDCRAALDCNQKLGELESARLVLQAHENLVAADESNRARFQDVLTFLRGRVNQG